MGVREELELLGGVATRAQLVAATSRREFDAARRAGQVVRLSRGRYAVPTVKEAKAVAHAMTGVLCLSSAALEWGWAVKTVPEKPHVTVPKHRKVRTQDAARVQLHRFRLDADDVEDGMTSKDRTLLDCLRILPFDEALAVADSALRDGYSRARMMALVRDARGPGAARMRHIAALASPLAANPFESVLRAIALGIPGLAVVPQVRIRRYVGSGETVFLGRPDLVDARLRIIIEADSFEFHGQRAPFRADTRRYNGFSVDGWLVLRFAWEDVMFEPAYVTRLLSEAVGERTQLLCPGCRCAS